MKWAIETNIGRIRKTNQDFASVFTKDNIVFAILCDGMGGHAGGEIASKVTVEEFGALFKKTKFKKDMNFHSFLRKGVKNVKKSMIKFANDDRKLLDMGTTLTAALIFDDMTIIYNIGDSRTYYYNGILHQVTKDQNLRNYYKEKKNLSDEEASKIWGASALTSALGPSKKSSADVHIVNFDNEKKYLILTSDGIHDFITKPYIERIIGTDKYTIKEKANRLIDAAMENNSTDNLTIIIMDVNNG